MIFFAAVGLSALLKVELRTNESTFRRLEQRTGRAFQATPVLKNQENQPYLSRCLFQGRVQNPINNMSGKEKLTLAFTLFVRKQILRR
ncbi:unnamed protein product [Calypogeia fissa]